MIEDKLDSILFALQVLIGGVYFFWLLCRDRNRGETMKPLTLRLDWYEVFHGAFAGCMREIDARKKSRQPSYDGKDPWGVNIEGACAELAVARLLNRYWHAIVSEFDGVPGDVGHYQVRSTEHEDGHLIVYEDDPGDVPFVLVTGTVPIFTVRGWLHGGEAKNPSWWRLTKRPAYWAPQSALHDLATLPREDRR